MSDMMMTHNQIDKKKIFKYDLCSVLKWISSIQINIL